MLKKLSLVSILLVASSGAFASVTLNPYIGGNVGSTSYTSSNGNSSTSTSAGLGWGAFLGVAFSRNFAIEGDYTSYGKVNDTDTYVSSLGVFLRAVAPIAYSFDIYGKAGFSSTTINGDSSSSDDTGSGFAFALGSDFKITHATSIFAQYQSDLASVGSTKLSPSMWSLGLKYMF
jgi:hypothetical protein